MAFIDKSSQFAVTASLEQSRLDFANSLLYGLSTANLHKLQCAQNSLRRINTVIRHQDCLSEHSRFIYLRWLPVRKRIQFKTAMLTLLHTSLLISCHTVLLVLYALLNQQLLKIRPAFLQLRYCSSKIRNEIPAVIKASAPVATFGRRLKSHFLSQLATQ